MNLFNTTSLPQNIKKCEHITSPEYDKHAEKKQGGVLMIFEKLRTLWCRK